MRPVLPALAIVSVLVGGVSAQDGQRIEPGPAAVGAQVRALVVRLGQPKVWRRAAGRLRRIGETAVEPMIEAISADGVQSSDVTFRVLRILEEMGPLAKSGYGPLGDALAAAEPKAFLALWHTLGTLVPYTESRGDRNEAQRLLQTAIQTLTSLPAEDRRTWTADYSRFTQRALVDPGRGLQAMIGEVKANATHRREVAAAVLGRMGKAAATAIPVLAKSLRGAIDVRQNTRKKPMARLQAIRVSNGRRQTRDEFCTRAAQAMIKIAPGDPRCAIAYGWDLREGKSPLERAAAALRIGSFGDAAKAEVPTLIAALGDADKRVRWEVITALGMLGATAKAAIPRLEALAAGDDKAAAARAKAALRQIRKG